MQSREKENKILKKNEKEEENNKKSYSHKKTFINEFVIMVFVHVFTNFSILNKFITANEWSALYV